MPVAPSLRLLGAVALLSAACSKSTPGGVASHVDRPTELAIVQEARCGACHALEAPLDAQLAASAPPSLDLLGAGVDPAADLAGLRAHFAGEHAADVRAWLRSLADGLPAHQPAEVAGGLVDVGARLVDELACRACHTPTDLDLARVADHAQLAAFLHDPAVALPGVAHVPLSESEASAVAAWILRGQLQRDAPQLGFAYEGFELRVDGEDAPDLATHEAVARGVADRMDVAPRPRDDDFALRYRATLAVPAAGEWTFVAGSDDGSWLWIDGELVVDNGGNKPHTEKEGTVELTAGPHQLEVVYTQARGGKSLEVQWEGPGVERAEIPRDVATASVARLVPPQRAPAPPDAAAIARGRAAARAARCDTCHAVGDAAFHALPAPPTARPWRELDAAADGGGACQLRTGPGLLRQVGALPASLSDEMQLYLSMRDDGCLSCHTRGGKGGLTRSVQKGLAELEDLGDEGRLPPDLTAVGRRLRREWIERVIAEGHKARDYVRVRMPAYGVEKARRYAAWFAALDAPGVTDEEPAFDELAAARGRELVGVGGRNCVTCHSVQGHRSLGPQGMDLAIQHERVRPGWMREWLWDPAALRPNTRMQQAWTMRGEADRRELADVLAWLSLGDAAPLPPGVLVDARSTELVASERPILHGAFLKKVSARCLCVGTPERTHFAYDLADPRLVWLWRGAFVDSARTWRGRAGQLVEPLGEDWVVVDDFTVAGAPARRVLGQRRTDDGYPVLRVAAGDASYEDVARPRLRLGGSELVRVITCTKGALRLTFPAMDGCATLVAGAPAGTHELAEGEALEVVYRW